MFLIFANTELGVIYIVVSKKEGIAKVCILFACV